jgi:hypothetical protein
MGLITFIWSLSNTTPTTGGPITWGSEEILFNDATITFDD